MKVSMESKYKAVSVIWAIFGALFFAGAGVMFIMRGGMPQMPRRILHISDFWLSVLYL